MVTRARLCDDVHEVVEDAHEEDSEDVVGAREEADRHVVDHHFVLHLDPVRIVRVVDVLNLLVLKIKIIVPLKENVRSTGTYDVSKCRDTNLDDVFVEVSVRARDQLRILLEADVDRGLRLALQFRSVSHVVERQVGCLR